MDFEQFSADWEKAFDLIEEITNANSVQSAEQIFNENITHPLTIYGLLDHALLIDPDKRVVKDCMKNILSFVKEPFPNPYFDLPTNDPIGEVMLKPIIHFPIEITQNSNPQLFIEWILVGYAYLYRSFQNQGIQAHDSLNTMADSIEQNSDDFAFLIFGHYLDIQDYSEAYTKFLIFCYLSAGLGFQKHRGNNQKFIQLTSEAKRYAEWLNQRGMPKEFDDLFDEGKAIADKMFNKVVSDIKSGQIVLSNLKVPI